MGLWGLRSLGGLLQVFAVMPSSALERPEAGPGREGPLEGVAHGPPERLGILVVLHPRHVRTLGAVPCRLGARTCTGGNMHFRRTERQRDNEQHEVSRPFGTLSCPVEAASGNKVMSECRPSLAHIQSAQVDWRCVQPVLVISGGGHDAWVDCCLKLAAPIGLSPLVPLIAQPGLSLRPCTPFPLGDCANRAPQTVPVSLLCVRST